MGLRKTERGKAKKYEVVSSDTGKKVKITFYEK